MKTVPKAALFLVLVLQVVGTCALLAYAFWLLMLDQPNRGDGLLYLSLGILWFMLLSWRVRWLMRPKPA